jgi:hypothetical protein
MRPREPTTTTLALCSSATAVIVVATPPRRVVSIGSARRLLRARAARPLRPRAARSRVSRGRASDARGDHLVGERETAYRGAVAKRRPDRQDARPAPRQHGGCRADSLLRRERAVVGGQHRPSDKRPLADWWRRVHAWNLQVRSGRAGARPSLGARAAWRRSRQCGRRLRRPPRPTACRGGLTGRRAGLP